MLSDDVGVIQHAMENVPNRNTGYCTDDVARAFVVALLYLRLFPADPFALRLASNCLAYLQQAQLEDGRFHNFMDYDRRWSERVGSQDSCGRAVLALGYGLASAPSEKWRNVCATLLDRALPSLASLTFIRSRAFAAIGLAYAHRAGEDGKYVPPLQRLAGEILGAYDATASDDWQWFEDCMTYDNARLCEAMIRAGGALGEPRYFDVGLRTLAFYATVTTEDGVHVPIGNDGWYPRGGRRARYAQQPLEAAAMVDAQLAAFGLTGDPGHASGAELAMEWYYGKNSRGAIMARGGGCFDGLEEEGVNRNMGAESTLALLAAAYTLAAAENVAVSA